MDTQTLFDTLRSPEAPAPTSATPNPCRCGHAEANHACDQTGARLACQMWNDKNESCYCAEYRAATTEAPKTSAASIFDKAVCLSVTLRRLGVRKKVATGAVAAPGTDPEALHVSKELLESKTFEDIVSLDGEIRAYVTTYCLPSPFKSGVYLLPDTVTKKVDSKLEAYKLDRQELVDRFVDEYPARVKAARDRLGPLFNPDDYPDADSVRAAFSMETKYLGFSTPERLKRISGEIWKREKDKAAREIASFTEQTRQLLRAQAAGLLQKMIERLSPKDDGSQKVFRDSLVENVNEFLATFADKNIAEDGELAGLMDKARKIMAGVNPEALRTDDQLRARIATQAAEITKTLDTMIIDRPKRKIDLDAE